MFYTLTELMKDAKESVTIHTPYAVFNSYMYAAMREVNARVPVDMMINSVENGDNFFASSDYLRHKEEIAKTGLTVYEYDGGMSYHGKSIVIDHRAGCRGLLQFRPAQHLQGYRAHAGHPERGAGRRPGGLHGLLPEGLPLLLPDGTYQIPDHVTVAPVPALEAGGVGGGRLCDAAVRFLI